MGIISATAGEKEDDRSSTTRLVDLEEKNEACVDLERNKHEIVSAQVSNNSGRASLFTWTVVNIVATIGILFTNKSIFSTPSFRNCQLSFA